MLRQLVSKQTYMVIITIGCLLISALSSAENALCLDVDDVSIDIPMGLNSCHLSQNDCSSVFIQEQRNTPSENDCQACFDFTFQDIVLTGIHNQDTTADLPPITISTDIHFSPPIYESITISQYLRRNAFTPPPVLATEKSIKSTILII